MISSSNLTSQPDMTSGSNRTWRSGRRATMVAGVLACLAATAFVILAAQAYRDRSGTAFDHTVLNTLIAHRTPPLTTLAVAITTLFDPVDTGVLALLSTIFLWLWLRSVRSAILVPITLAAAATVSTVTKYVVGAHRPPAAVRLVSETDPSFPSGHVTGTVALLGTVAVVVGYHRGRLVRIALIAITVAVGVLVSSTRLYLGVHWVIDVIGGFALGSTAVLIALVMYIGMMQVPDRSAAEPPDPMRATATTSPPRT